MTLPNKLPTGDIILAAETYGIKGSTACVDALLDRVDGVDVSALRLLVMEAFKANSQGFLSTGRVLSLMRMEVNNSRGPPSRLNVQNHQNHRLHLFRKFPIDGMVG